MRIPLVLALSACLALTGCEIRRTVSEEDAAASGATVFELYAPQRNLDAAFNVVFVPDVDYGSMAVLANRQRFVDDMADVIMNGFWQNRAYFNGLFHFNYYYMTAGGSVTERPLDSNGNFQCPTTTWPAQVNTDAAFADLLILVHTNELRDCGGGGRATAEPTSFRTMVHEAGHAIFGIPDEYCCDGGYFTAAPVMYGSQSACTSDAANAGWRNCQSIVSTRVPGTFWRSQGDVTQNLIMRNAGDEVWESGRADWEAMRRAYRTLDGSPDVGAPATFAPDRWSYTVPPAP